PPGWAYLKIAEGCDNRCTYCAIPSIRGGFRSRPLPAVLEEAGRLVAAGARELVLVAQDTTRYGMDLYGQPVLHRLLEELDGLAGLEWVRVMYAHPGRVSGAVREALRGLPKVVPYLDLPLQHVADRVLARMGRGYTGAQARELIDCLRRDVPGIALRTTLMVGFPGESREEFAQLRRFVEEERLDWLGVFAFAAEEGTAAAAWGDSVSPEEK
ncbi:MAG: radical SAM protein, partial [Syntrophomonadaceae bacterium]|nr:radical SAM protein [Syntrophomonadaceae bacterium]